MKTSPNLEHVNQGNLEILNLDRFGQFLYVHNNQIMLSGFPYANFYWFNVLFRPCISNSSHNAFATLLDTRVWIKTSVAF